jgi:formyl-CoA transferase
VRVLAVENYLAGNYGTFLLGLLGAEIIKVELPGKGDALRTNAPYCKTENGTRSNGELRLMPGKRSIELDIHRREGLAIFMRLVGTADVVWSNMKAESLTKIGITYPALKMANPRVVYTTITGFGHDDLLPRGPHTDLLAFDLIAQGMAGLQYRTESDSDRPAYNGIPIGDQATSVFAAMGTVVALFERTSTGVGRRVDIAMYDSMISLNEKPIGLYSITGEAQPRGVSANSAPYGAYRTRDGFLNITVGGEPIWRRFCQAIGKPELVADPRFAQGTDRVVNSKALNALVEQWSSVRTRSEAMAILIQNGVPCAPLQDVAEIMVDPQVAARNMLLSYLDPIVGEVTIVGNPIKIDGAFDGPPNHPHSLGEDTVDILTSIGITSHELTDLARDGVVGVIGESLIV